MSMSMSSKQPEPIPLYSTDITELHKTITRLYGGARFGDDQGRGERPDGILTTFGEILPAGVSDALNLLSAADATKFVDFGMGGGKAAMQAFLQYPKLQSVIGIELVTGRFEAGAAALKTLKAEMGSTATLTGKKSANGASVVTLATKDGRVLEFRHDNLLNCADCLDAPVAFMEIAIPASAYGNIKAFLNSMKAGTRLLTYADLRNCYYGDVAPMPWVEFELFRSYAASWGQPHFYLWKKQ